MTRSSLILPFLLGLAGSATRGADDATRMAGEWKTTMGPLTLDADGPNLAGGLQAFNLVVKGQAQDGKITLGYDQGKVHVDATLTLDPDGRSFSGPAHASNGNRWVWEGWHVDPSAAKGEPADFAGLWLTDLGLMELAGDGKRFRGRYALRGTSTIEGEVTGRHLDGRIKSLNWTGPAAFDRDEAGTTFHGAGGTDGMAPWYRWEGRKADRYVRHAPLVAGQIVDGSTEGLLTYSVRAPESFKADDGRKWPVALVLHGSNMNGRAYVNTIAATWPDIARDYILLGINGEIPSRLDPADPAFNYTYVNFMGRSTYSGYPGTDRESPALVREAMEELRRVYPLGRCFVGGHSQGGYLAYTLMMHSPDLFAGAFPISAGLMMQNEPDVFADEAFRRAQRAIPLAIVHGRTDPNVGFAAGTAALGSFLDAGWPAVRMFADDRAGHMFALLPVGPAIRWLEALTADDPTLLLDFAARRLAQDAPRDAIAALRRARPLRLDPSAQARLDQLAARVDAAAGPRAAGLVAAMQAGKDFGWVADFRAFRAEYEYADAAAPALAAFAPIRQAQDQPAKKLLDEGQALLNRNKPAEGYARMQEIADKYPASSSYRLARIYLDRPH